MRIGRTGVEPVRRLSRLNGAVAAALLAAAPFALPAGAARAETVAAPAIGAGQDVAAFYAARQQRPLWLEAGRPSVAAMQLLGLLDSARVDGLDPNRYRTQAIAKALRSAAAGSSGGARKAEQLLSAAYVAYARDLRAAPPASMEFFDPTVRPAPPPARTLLEMAARAPSLQGFIAEMGWMSPLYAPLRRALASGQFSGPRQREVLRLNLARARVLPGRSDRYVVVNAASQRLSMYEGRREVASMRVVVGKQKDNNRTPMMAGLLRLANLNPYWNVPADLAAERIAPNVLKEGLSYLKTHGYQVLSDWSDNAQRIDPATIDWKAVADGRTEVRVRQLPGPGNALGKVKFNFPNPYGVYLHDTPDKQLLTEETRLFSGGCIRLEDASRFGEWLYGHPLKATSRTPELPVPLDRPVPIYVTYMTAVPDGSSIVYFNDVYGWDAQRLAQLGGGAALAAR